MPLSKIPKDKAIAKNETPKPKIIQTAAKPPKTTKADTFGKIINDNQKKVEPKLDFHGEKSKKSILRRTASMLKPKLTDKTVNKSHLNDLSRRSKSSLGLPRVTVTCNASTPTPLKMQAKNANQSKNQGADEIQLRATEKSKLLSFEHAKEKLSQMQSMFMEKCENLKDIKTVKIRGSYKFICLVLNDSCKLVVNEDDLIRLPKNIPRDSVNEFKETVQEAFHSSLNLLDRYFVDHKIADRETKWRLERETLRKKLKQHQDSKFNDLMTRIDSLCKNSPNNETELTRALDELQETKQKFDEFKMQMQKEQSEIIAQHKAEIEAREHEHDKAKANLETVALRKKDDEIDLSKNKINELLQENADLQKCITETTYEFKKNSTLLEDQIAHKNRNIDDFLKEIDELKMCINEVRNEKKISEDNLIAQQMEITQLKKELEKSKIDINRLQSRADEISNMSNAPPHDTHELDLLKRKLEDMLPLQEQNNLYKDLLDIRFEKITNLQLRESDLKAQIESLKVENFQQESHISQLTMEMSNKANDFHRLMDTSFEKEKDLNKLQHSLKLYEERMERSRNIQDQLKQTNEDQSAEITKLKMRVEYNKVVERMKFTENSDDSQA